MLGEEVSSFRLWVEGLPQVYEYTHYIGLLRSMWQSKETLSS